MKTLMDASEWSTGVTLARDVGHAGAAELGCAELERQLSAISAHSSCTAANMWLFVSRMSSESDAEAASMRSLLVRLKAERDAGQTYVCAKRIYVRRGVLPRSRYSRELNYVSNSSV